MKNVWISKKKNNALIINVKKIKFPNYLRMKQIKNTLMRFPLVHQHLRQKQVV